MKTIKTTIRAIEADLIQRIGAGAEIWLAYEDGAGILANGNSLPEIIVSGLLRQYGRERAVAEVKRAA